MRHIILLITLLYTITLLGCSDNVVEPKSGEKYIEFIGERKWDPGHFTPPPEEEPLEMSMELHEIKNADENKILMKLHLQNTSQDTVYIGGGKHYSEDGKPVIYYDFVFLKADSTRIWSRIRAPFRAHVGVNLALKPYETFTFKDTWNYSNYDGEQVEPGAYFLYGGIENLSITDANDRNRRYLYDSSFPQEKKIGPLGTGVGPEMLIVN